MVPHTEDHQAAGILSPDQLQVVPHTEDHQVAGILSPDQLQVVSHTEDHQVAGILSPDQQVTYRTFIVSQSCTVTINNYFCTV